jgi:uncharacterized membrane protein
MGNETGAMVNRDEAHRTLTHVVYGLYAASLLVGVTALVAIIINYVKRGDVAGTWLESHFRWQIRTFWFALLWGVLGALTLFFGVGMVVLLAGFVWYVYRIVKGWLYLFDGKRMYAPAAPGAVA